MSDSSSSPSGKVSQQAIGVPAAIVVAGGLIALAVYFGGSNVRSPQPAQTPTVGANQGVPSAAPAAPAIGDFRAIAASDHVRGATNAKVTLLEYSDIECPFCKRFHPTLEQALREYPNDVRWVYRHYPLEQLHPNARGAALATECAHEQGKFWEMLDYLFTNTETGADLALDKLPGHAASVGVANATQFKSCLDSKKYDERVAQDMTDAETAGGRGTPYTIAIGPDGTKKAISGAQPYASVKATIDELLAK